MSEGRSSFLKGLFAVPLEERLIWFRKVLIATLVMVAAGLWFASHYRVGFDKQTYTCIGASLLIIDITDRTPVRDAVFAYRAKNAAPVYPDGTLMAKYVRGMPGDTVTITEEGEITVGEHYRTRGMPYIANLPEEKRKTFAGKKTLAKGEFWMMGTSPRSFDSRYWGTIRDDQIVGRAYVIF